MPLIMYVSSQLQNNVYEIVSDMNQKQEVLDERVAVLEDRLSLILEQLEVLPETLAKVIQQMQIQQHAASVIDSVQQTTSSTNPQGQPLNTNAVNQSDPPIHRHTHLHPNDAASLAARPSWSATNLTTPVNRQLLAPVVPRAGSFDA